MDNQNSSTILTQVILDGIALSDLVLSIPASSPIFSSSVSFTSLPIYPINSNFSIKLYNFNYLIWKEKLKHFINVFDQIRFCFTLKSLKKLFSYAFEISKSYEIFEDNPKFLLWDRQDSAIKKYDLFIHYFNLPQVFNWQANCIRLFGNL